MRQKLLVNLAAAGSALFLYMLRNAFHSTLKTEQIELDSKHSFKPFNLLFISDIHRRRLPRDFSPGSPDLIIIGGDFVEKGVPLERAEHNLRVLSSIAETVFVWGNNDRELNEQDLRKLMAKYNIRILENESMPVLGQPHLKLVTIDYFASGENILEQAFSRVTEEDTVIFVSHTPFIFNRVQKNYRAALMLGGHTHGGQIRLGKYGIYEKGKTEVKDGVTRLISNGYGTTTLPLRLGAEAEYHLLTVKPKAPSL